jgi:Glycosyl transferase family 11
MEQQRTEVELCGGVGNQLFQYAAARSISDRLNTELDLNLAWYTKNSRTRVDRTFLLDKLIDVGNATLSTPRCRSGITRVALRMGKRRLLHDVFITPEHFNSFVTDKNIIMRGYWQDPRYFENITEIMREAFGRRFSLSENASSLRDQISATSTLGIHVRRGDYVSDRRTSEYHGVCDQNYFHNALRRFNEISSVEQLVIFSDDTSWCREKLSFSTETIVVEDTIQDLDQLRLLSSCNHHIISNSSFSWWAAWFGFSDNQVVIFPNRWFADGRTLAWKPSHWIGI